MLCRTLTSFMRKQIKGGTHQIKFCFGSYYKMVEMFKNVEEVSGNKEKMGKIRQFKASLSEEDRQQFNHLMTWYSHKQPIRVSTKIVNKYYLNTYIQPEERELVQPDLAEGAVMRRLSKENKESQLTLYDVNIFLRYLSTLEGTGAQKQKARKIVMFGENVSVLQGVFLLKLIERRLTIGASSKTFSKADHDKPENETVKQEKIKKPRKKKDKPVETE